MSLPETDGPGEAAERLDDTIERLLAEREPGTALDAEEAELWQVAALLKQARPDLATPRSAFVAALAGRVRAASVQPANRLSAAPGARRQRRRPGGRRGRVRRGRLTDPHAVSPTSAAANPPARPRAS